MSAIRVTLFGLLAIGLSGALISASTAADATAKTESASNATPDSTEKAEASSATTPTWKLQYQFRQGEFFHFQAKSESTMRVSARGVSQTLREKRETYKHFRVVAVDKDGSAVLEPVIDRAIMQARSDNDEAILWDSRSKATVPMRFQPVAESVGKPKVRVRYKSNGEVEEVLPVGGKKEDLNPDTSSYGFLVRLPDEPVAIGESWNDDFVVKVSPEPDLSRKLRMDVEIRRIYTLKKVANGVATIAFHTSVKKPIREPIIKAQLISRSLTGTVDFELKRGLILKWASVGSGQVISPYGSGTMLESSLASVERFATKSAAFRKPVASNQPPSVASEPGRVGVNLPPGRGKF
jgi:hypothetical protein